MPEGPLGFYRPFGVAPRSFDSEERDRRIEQVLSKCAKRENVNVESRLRGTHFNFRLDVSHRTAEIPRGQNIPSNLVVVGSKAKGTLRPPIIHARAVSRGVEEIRRKLDDMIGYTEGVDIALVETRGEPSWRPHIEVDRPARVNDYLHAAEAIVDNYAETFS